MCSSDLLSLGRIYSAFTLRHQSYSLRNYMKEFVEAIQEVDLYPTSLRAIGGQIYRMKRKNMLGNVINVKDSRQTFTSLKEFLILFPVLGLLFNGDWIL